MQNSKNRNGSLEVPQKTSPATPRKLKVPASGSDSVPSPNRASRTPKDKSPKVVDRRSNRSPAEKKRPSKVSELESQLSQLQEELKKTKNELASSESTAKRAQEETEEAKNGLVVMSAKLDASQKQLTELSASKELEDAQNQHSSDLDNLRHELTETHFLVEKLNCQLSKCEKSESRALELLTDTQVKLEMAKTVEENLRAEEVKAKEAYKLVTLELEKLKTQAGGDNNQHSSDLDNLRLELTETRFLVEKLKCQLSNCEKSESRALELLTDTQVKLEMAKTVEENLRAEGVKAKEAYKSVTLELEKLKTRAGGDNNQHSSDLDNLRLELTETHFLVEKLKCQLSKCEKSESQALELLTDTQVKLDMAETVEENLRAEVVKANEAYKSVTLELENLKTRAGGENNSSDKLKSELLEVKAEVENLKSALDLAEKGCHEENIRNTFVIRSAHEQMEHMKAELALREVEMGAELERAKAEIEEQKVEIMAYKETKNENGAKLERAKVEIEELKAEIMAYKETENKVETELKRLENEREVLKAELGRREEERKKENEESAALVEAARASEREALMKVGFLTEEVDKSNRKAARVVEQLEAVQGTNSEMEAELRRLKVQSDQWRKAAEAAAAMISSGHNGKLVERTGSLDKGYNTIGAKLGSPLSEDFDDESPKKKNGNMLRKFGFFGKKGQK